MARAESDDLASAAESAPPSIRTIGRSRQLIIVVVALTTACGCAAAHRQRLQPVEQPGLVVPPALDGEMRSSTDPTPSEGQRACDACPSRNAGSGLLQTTGINVLYGLANLARGQVTARVTPGTWWANMRNGWEWDLDDFLVNQIGHPYQGSNYFTAGRSNGLSFFESAAVTAFGSGTWEYFGETNHPSLNDFINTTLGGIALGEMFHRTAWLVRDTHATGRRRMWREIGAAAIDPITGLNRLLTGDASIPTGKPAQFIPTDLGGLVAAGVLWRGSNVETIESTAHPFIQVDLRYGDTEVGRSRTPYDAFTLRFTAGGGGGVSEARVRGRLLAQPFGRDRLQFSVIQSYGFLGNAAFHSGAQSVELSVGGRRPFTSRTSLALIGWGGMSVLGAVDSLPLDNQIRQLPATESPRQGISVGPRHYDYGPGSAFGGSATLSRDGRTLASVLYEGRTLHSLDGVRANHLLQRGRLDVTVPFRDRLGVGATGELFSRRSYYQDSARTRREYRFPQFRVYLTWTLG